MNWLTGTVAVVELLAFVFLSPNVTGWLTVCAFGGVVLAALVLAWVIF